MNFGNPMGRLGVAIVTVIGAVTSSALVASIAVQALAQTELNRQTDWVAEARSPKPMVPVERIRLQQS